MTDAMYSLSFLDLFSKIVFNPSENKVSVSEFYNSWLYVIDSPEVKIPFSLGSFAGYLFCGLLIIKENWSVLLPKNKISELDKDWGLNGISVMVRSKVEDPLLFDFVRRLRNSLAHTNFLVSVPSVDDARSINEIHNLVRWSFTDIDLKDRDNIFEVTMSMAQLEMLIKKLQSIVHRNIRNTINSD